MNEGQVRFGELLRRHRVAAGLTQEELAERAHVSARGISDLERGARTRPYAATVGSLVKALGLSRTELDHFRAVANAWRDQTAPAVVHSSASSRGGLPVPNPPTSFVGRSQELADVRRLLATTRLLTLSGMGGIGKTRLALEVAREMPDCAFVDLAPIVDHRFVVAALAAGLGIREESTATLLDVVANTISRRGGVLVILDNCEHVVGECARIADHLLKTCKQFQILATSRQPLAVAGEQLWYVPPMIIGADEETAGSDAPRLFVERARLVQPGASFDDRSMALVAEICWRLDGIPLAIELAAARTRMLSLEQIRTRLDDRFETLTNAQVNVPKRQQTLRGTLDWSYDLLSPLEQMLFKRLSVFGGEFSLDDVVGVCSAPPIDENAVLELLTRLVDKSLVTAEPLGQSEVRFRLLDTVRVYARDHRTADADDLTLGDRHAAYFLNLAETIEFELSGPQQRAFLDLLEQEQGNLRAALEFLLDAGCAERAARLCAALWRFWATRGHLTEGRQWIRRTLEHEWDLSATVRANALNAEAWLALLQADYGVASARSTQCLTLRRLTGELSGEFESLMNLAEIARQTHDYDHAATLIEQCLALRAHASSVAVADALNIAGMILGVRGDVAGARERYAESLSLRRAVGDVRGVASTVANLGELAQRAGDHDLAATHYHESLSLRRDLGDMRGATTVLALLGDVARNQGQIDRARQLYEEGLAVALALGAKRQIDACRAGLIALTTVSRAPAPSTGRDIGLDTNRVSLGKLTRREREIAQLICHGLTNGEIARELTLSERTVHSHIRSMLSKLAVRSRAHIAAIAAASQQPA